MKTEKANIDDLKTRYAEIYEGGISFSDAEDNQHEVEFIFRKPNTIDIESHIKAAQKNPIVANLNLVQSLIVHPEPLSVIESIKDYPVAYGKFVDEVITPFFGANAAARKRKL